MSKSKPLNKTPSVHGDAFRTLNISLKQKTIAALQQRAESRKHSLEQEIRMILTYAVYPERSELVAMLKRIRAESPKSSTDVVHLLREDRDR